jgi:hypothetical protein
MEKSGDGPDRQTEKAVEEKAPEGVDPPRIERLISDGAAAKIAVEVVAKDPASPAASTATPAPADAPSTNGQSASGASSGAYPSDALVAALGTGVEAKELWADVHKGKEQEELAASLIKGSADARIELLKKSAWAAAPEMVLLEALGPADRARLSKKILEVRTGVTDKDDERRAAEVGLAAERTATAKVAREMLEEAKEQMKVWKDLASLGRTLLMVAGGFSAVAIVGVLVLAGFGKLGEVATPATIFALAVFAISPAVLLLRERPLEGLDKWTPDGPTKSEGKEGEEEDGGSGSAAKTAAG